jgi:branched-chain amino acid transport system substrate-binding protein
LNQLDFSAELAKIAAAKPDAIYVFLPGGMGVNFVKQFRQAGLANNVTFLSAFTVDESTLAGPAGCRARFLRLAPTGRPISTIRRTRASSPPTRRNSAQVPATYAFQAYDAALLIDSAVRQVQGTSQTGTRCVPR